MSAWADHRDQAQEVWERLPLLLAHWGSDTAKRSAVRAKLPSGNTVYGSPSRNARRLMTGATGNRNVVTHTFGTALNRMERAGLIVREGDIIRILDRPGLRAWAAAAAPEK